MPIAYSYARFSSEKQSKGDSLRRQRDLALQFIERNPDLELELDTTLNLTDEGLSAYKGVAQTKGALGAFIRLVMEGTIEKGSYLLVESLDRLSRQTPRQALNQLNILADEGIVLVTLSDNKVYTKETLDEDGGISLMFAIMLMSRAHEESQTKSLRISAAWANKFNKIKEGKQLTARVPFWINKADKSKAIPEKVAIVKEIFKLSASGLGAMKIAQELNASKTPTPTAQSKKWAVSSVKKVLASEAVLGTLITADGQRHEGYYPAIINPKIWLKTRFIGQSSSTARATTEVHPLSGLMFCKHCGATAQRGGKSGRVRADGTRNYWKTLVCANALINPKDENGKPKNKKECEYRSIGYDRILGYVKVALIQMEEYAPNDEVGKQLKQKRDRAEQIQDLIDMVTSPIDGKYQKETPTRKANLAKFFLELEAVKKEIAELEQIRRPTSQRLFEGARKAILNGEVTNALMRQTIKRCEIDFNKARLDVYGHDGNAILELEIKSAEELQIDENKRRAVQASRFG